MIVLAFLTASPVWALERFDIISTQELEHLLKEREAKKTDFILVNTLDEIIYRSTSIPGSVNIPWSRIDETKTRLGSDKEKLLIFY
jgi:3-mercaptopyruvate sulfurtransferase SseA